MESCDCDKTSIHDCVCPQCRIRFLEHKLEEAKKALLLLNDFLWYETVPAGYKELIIKKLQENDCRVDQGWDKE